METSQSPTSASSQESRLHFLDYWRIIRVRKLVILAVFLLVVTTTTVVTLWLPKTYDARATIRVDKDVREMGILGGKTPNAVDLQFIQTEYQVLQSQDILYKVIDDLGLAERWSRRYGYPRPLTRPETFELLVKRRMDIRPERNTSIIEIRVYSEDAQEAAEIANKVADVYKAYRENSLEDRTQGGLKSLRQSQKRQQEVVDEAKMKVDDLRENLGITDIMANNDEYVSTIDVEVVRGKERQQSEARVKELEARAKLDKITQMAPLEQRSSLNVVQPDQNLMFLMQQRDLAEQNLVSKKSVLGPENDEVKQAQAELDTLDKRIDERVAGIVAGIRVQYESSKGLADALAKELADAKQADLEMQNKSRPYYEAKQLLKSERQKLEDLKRKVFFEETDANLPTDIVRITNRAEAALKPIRPSIPLNIAASIIVGLIAGIGLAFFIEYLDTSVKTIDDIEQVLQAPVLSVIPQGIGSLIDEGPESPNAEAYRVLRTNILFGRKHEGMNAITVVSGGAAEGKSTTLCNLAATFAHNDNRILLVDTDLRRPSLHKFMGVSNSVGLTNYLLKQQTLEEVIISTKVPGLDFLPSGKLPSSALGILNSPKFHEFVQEVKRRYDFVLFDAPPILGVSDASILVREVDMVMLVVQHRKYPQAMNVRARQTIDKFNGNLLGVVLNNINIAQDSYYYYYSGYGYGYSNENQDTAPAPSKDAPDGKPADVSDKLKLKKKY